MNPDWGTTLMQSSVYKRLFIIWRMHFGLEVNKAKKETTTATFWYYKKYKQGPWKQREEIQAAFRGENSILQYSLWADWAYFQSAAGEELYLSLWYVRISKRRRRGEYLRATDVTGKRCSSSFNTQPAVHVWVHVGALTFNQNEIYSQELTTAVCLKHFISEVIFQYLQVVEAVAPLSVQALVSD